MIEPATPQERLRSRLVRAFSWNLIGSVFERLLALAMGIVLARALGRESFGKFGIILATASFMAALASEGLGTVATRFTAELRNSDPGRLARILSVMKAMSSLLGLVLLLLLLGGSDLLAERVLKDGALSFPLRTVAVIVLCLQIVALQLGILAGLEAFRATAVLRFVAGIVRIVAVLGGLWLRGLEGALIGYAVSYVVETLLGGWMAHRALRAVGIGTAGLGRSWCELRSVMGSIVPAMAATWAAAPANWVSQAILVRQPLGLESLGLYNAANQWRTAILLMPGKVSEVSTPILANLVGNGDWSRFRKVFRSNLVLVTLLGVSGALVVGAGTPWILKLYGRDYADGSLLVAGVGVVGALQALGDYLAAALAGLGMMWTRLLGLMGWAMALLVAAWFLVPLHMAMGLLLADLCARGVRAVLGILAMGISQHGQGQASARTSNPAPA